MGKHGFKVLDADTHVYEPCEVLEKYLSTRWKEALAGSTTPIARTALRGGMHTYIVGDPKSGQRRLGSREKVSRPTAPSADKRASGTPWGVQWKGPPWPTERVNVDSHARVADMDIEGVDVHVIIPTRGVNGFASADDVGLELAMYEAYHRYMADYCGPHPTRLKSIILASGRDIDGTVKEIERCAKEAWPVALFPITPVGMPIDDPGLDPLWARAVEYDLAVLVHPFRLNGCTTLRSSCIRSTCRIPGHPAWPISGTTYSWSAPPVACGRACVRSPPSRVRGCSIDSRRCESASSRPATAGWPRGRFISTKWRR